MQKFIRIHKLDNVAVALTDLQEGVTIPIDDKSIRLIEAIPAGHKFAIKEIGFNHKIIKYGSTIGVAKEVIKIGSWVHTHNIKTTLDESQEYEYRPEVKDIKPSQKVYFQGFKRNDGKVGIRNEIWIIPTVGCVNSIATALEKQAVSLVRNNIEGIVSFPHPYGCSQMGDDQENTRQILADMINHPNAGGVLVLGLGCENSNIAELKPYIGKYDERRVKFLQCQDVDDELEAAMTLLEDLADYTDSFQREQISAEELIIGLKCGGSDGFSGITANPLVGVFSDLTISKGGTTILTEVPEMFGAETLLMNRCKNNELFGKTVRLINDFKQYYISNNQTVYENPSPGNKKGGISTLEDKSLGCTQKSGNAPVSDVLSYGETVKIKGLNLLSAPGNDLVASTALAAAGAHIVLFTTGRGTPFAAPVPTVKIASNTPLSMKKANWIDFNAGQLVEGSGMDELAEQLLHYVMEVASGKKVKAEEEGYHDMAIFKKGVTL
ncbi:UxaA family hydrolase [Anaerocolumna sp. MB42-C2]|uniref:UxaA family hydrolase n=1 Tax=Anaerocolumna sp. MB42-C2 TaxID=3070997 RepID=UPI0027E0BBF4|nr:altronate dehydratase family protein [Anaerocolumna sp. MB42-C2]WMJ88326.1 altronate dehydratase family protein [Anaerocolumna sp. MB42-C2]